MARTSPCFYIAPTSISVTPNANGSANDLAVNVVKGTKIKIYSQGLSALGYSDASFQQWTLAGRNRRLSDSEKPYTIYARLAKNNKEDGYLVFAPKEADGEDWLDKYAYITINGLATDTANKNNDDYWYIKIGDVSKPTDNTRTVTLDTGILGTDRFNTEWNLDSDQLPLRIELTATIDSKDAGDKPYVAWGEELILQAKLLEGWADANVQRFHHFTIQRNTGDTEADVSYNYPSTGSSSEKPSSGRQMPNGNVVLAHARGAGDVFNGTVSSTWTVVAWGVKTDATDSTSSSDDTSSKAASDSYSSISASDSLSSESESSKDESSTSSTDGTAVPDAYEKLVEKSINIMAETAEQYALEMSSSVVNYDPSSDTYNPTEGVDVMVRATDQKGEVFKLINVQLKAACLAVQYSVASLEQWNDCDFADADDSVAKANIPIEAFHLQQNVNVRIVKTETTSGSSSASSSASSAESNETTYKEIYRTHIALIRNGEDSKEREWIFLRSATALSFADTADEKHRLLPSLIASGEIKPEEAATGTDANKNQDGWVPEGWWDNSLGTDKTYHYEYTAYRDYVKGSHTSGSSSSSSGNAVQRGGYWGDFSTPTIWSYYAEDAVSYRCRWTLAGVEVYQLNCAYTGAFRGTLPLVATLMKRVGSGQEQEVSGETIIVLTCEGIDYSKTFNAENPTFTVSTTDVNTADFVQYLNSTSLASLSASFAVNGEEHKFSIPVIREADEDSVKETVKEYGDKMYLSKIDDDTAQGLITFAKGLIATITARLKGGATFGNNGYAFDKDGNVVVNAINSLAFDEALQKGFGFTKNASGKYTLSVTDLMVWGKAVFNSLEIRKLYSVGGNVYLSGASSKIQYVSEVKGTDGTVTGWKCYILADDGTTATQNGWAKYDQAKCQTFDIQEGTYDGVSNTFYWRLVTDVSTENEAITETATDADGNETTTTLYDGKKFGWIVLSASDCEATTNDAPKAGDTIVLDGHRQFATGDAQGRDQYNDTSRTNVMMLETTGTGNLPRIVALTNIVDYKHSEDGNAYSNTVFILSPAEVVFVSSAIKWISASGDAVTMVNFRGAWVEGTSYSYYDQVSHNNSIWTCIVEKGTTTTLEPTADHSSVWRMEITGTGDKGEDAVTYELVASPGYIKLDADGSIDTSNKNSDDIYLLVNGYRTTGSKREHEWATKDSPITVCLYINYGNASYYCVDYGDWGSDEGVHTEFIPSIDSYGDLVNEIKENGLKSALAVMYKGDETYSSPDKIPSDKFLAELDIPIVQAGASGTSYGVSLAYEQRTVSSAIEDCLVATFTKSDADGVTSTENVQVVGGYAQLYIDGTLNDTITARLNGNTTDAGELAKSAYPAVFTANYITVKWYDKEGGTLLGMGNLTRGADGKSAVAYGVQMSACQVYEGSSYQSAISLQYTKTTGATVETYTNITTLGCTAKVYADGVEVTDVSEYINRGNYQIVFSHYTIDGTSTGKGLDTASVITVMLYLDGTLVASANFANGKQGMGAFEIIADPGTIVIDSDDNGLASGLSSASAALMCLRDGKEVSGVTFVKGTCVNCAATVSAAGVVTITNVTQQTVNGVTVSCTSGSVTVNATDPTTKNTYTKTIPFAVNVSKLNGSMIADNKKFTTVYNELTNNGASTDLTWYESKIEQTARNISLKVQEKNVGRRNLLTGSAFRKQEDGWAMVQEGQGGKNGIAINDGYEGTNAVRIYNASTSAYPRVCWGAGNPYTSNVKVEKGKQYILSFWAKRLSSSASGYEISTQFFLQDGESGQGRPYGALKFGSSTVGTQWELIQDTVTIPSDAKAEYVEVDICIGLTASGEAEVLISRPMLEEGDEYNGWTQSEQDYDYVGGNLLDNTAKLTKGGNLSEINGDVVQGGYGESASVTRTLPTTVNMADPLAFTTSDMGLKAGEDYILSFYAKASTEASAGRLQCYLYSGSSTSGINTEDSTGTDNSRNPSDGSLLYGIVPTTSWKRYWVHWRPTGADKEYVRLRVMQRGTSRGSYSSTETYAVDDVVLYDGTYWRCTAASKGNTPSTSSSYWEATIYNVSIAQPKLEAGATMTEWTEKRADMVDKQALLATGIDIENKKITLTADNTVFQDNSGKELAVIDEDGLHASKISTVNSGSGNTVISGNTTVWYQKDGATPGIAVFYDAAGVPHFQFYGTDGKVAYDFGPSGLQSFLDANKLAYSDICYLYNASDYVNTNGDTITGFRWCYEPDELKTDKKYIYRKQTTATKESSASDAYDGCVFTKEYSGNNWPSSDNFAYLLADGWYIVPSGTTLPTEISPAVQSVTGETETVYYQKFYKYENGKVAKTVRAYMTKISSAAASMYMSNGKWDEY